VNASLRTFAVVFSTVLAGCGFHLRGSGTAQTLHESLNELRVSVDGSRAAHDPLLTSVQNALRTQAGVTVVEATDAPQLLLGPESVTSQVLSVGSNTRVSEYLLKYELSFRLLDGEGKELMASQTVRLERDYRYDPLNVLAKEREEEELKKELRRQAVQNLLRRLSRYKPAIP
jgi:LPS-assembly lipoprotein